MPKYTVDGSFLCSSFPASSVMRGKYSQPWTPCWNPPSWKWRFRRIVSFPNTAISRWSPCRSPAAFWAGSGCMADIWHKAGAAGWACATLFPCSTVGTRALPWCMMCAIKHARIFIPTCAAAPALSGTACSMRPLPKRPEKIVTVSEFSKSEIVKYYHVNPEKITVVYNAWQHMQRVRPDPMLFGEYSKWPQLKKGRVLFLNVQPA